MTITKINRNNYRSSTAIPFFIDAVRSAIAAGNTTLFPASQAQTTKVVSLIANGSLINTESISEDGLTHTVSSTIADLSTLNQLENARTIAAQMEFIAYKNANNFAELNAQTLTLEDRLYRYSLGGIDAPYTVTTTYTFTSSTDPFIDTFVAGLETYEHFNKLIDLVINGADVIVTHQYLNSADHSTNPYFDMFFAPQLAEKGVTRTIHYAMV